MTTPEQFQYQQQPYQYQPLVLRAPEGTNPSTAHIWMIVALSFVLCIPSFIYLGTFDFSSFMTLSMEQPDNPMAVYGQMFTPAYAATMVAGFLGYTLTAVLAFFDSRALAARGLPKPFHWAFSLIPSYGTYVYVIGRSVVAYRRTSRGLAPLWVFIGVNVLTFVILTALTVVMMNSMFASIEQYVGY